MDQELALDAGRRCSGMIVCAIAMTVSSSCAAFPDAAASAKELPAAFDSPLTAPDFELALAPARVEARILRSECASMSADLSQLGMDSGLSTRPQSASALYLDRGQTRQGVQWFLMRSQDDPAMTYCGISFVANGNGTNVSVVNVRHKDKAAAREAVASGDFLCRCKQLAR